MTTASFIISIVALAVSAHFARQQAVAAKRLTALEEANRLDQRLPNLVGAIDPVRESYFLRLHLKSPWPIASLTAAIVEGHGVAFNPDQGGVDPSKGEPPLTAAHAALLTGGVAEWRVDLSDDRSSEIMLRVRCVGPEGQEWTVPVPVKTPTSPRIHWL